MEQRSLRPHPDRPLARGEGLLVEEIGEETVVYDTDSGEAHCLSPLAAAVFSNCDGKRSLDELARLGGSKLGEPVDAEHIDVALTQLEARSLLAPSRDGISRRGFVRRTAVATAAVSAAPMVTSVVTPAFAQGTSPQLNCEQSPCASSSEGDAWCGCINDCPPSNNHQNSSTCAPYDPSPGSTQPNSGGAFYGSCECLRCPRALNATDNGEFQDGQVTGLTGLQLGFLRCQQIYGPNYWKINPAGPDNAANWKDWSAPCTATEQGSESNPTYWQYGCKDTGKRIDGACYNEPGNTSQPGLGLICETD